MARVLPTTAMPRQAHANGQLGLQLRLPLAGCRCRRLLSRGHMIQECSEARVGILGTPILKRMGTIWTTMTDGGMAAGII